MEASEIWFQEVLKIEHKDAHHLTSHPVTRVMCCKGVMMEASVELSATLSSETKCNIKATERKS